MSELGDASHRQTHPMSAGKGRPQRASESDEKGGADRWDKAAEGVMGLGCIGLLSMLLLPPATPPPPRFPVANQLQSFLLLLALCLR